MNKNVRNSVHGMAAFMWIHIKKQAIRSRLCATLKKHNLIHKFCTDSLGNGHYSVETWKKLVSFSAMKCTAGTVQCLDNNMPKTCF